jgi:L-ascorbate metabolism protein UlaG (beta-lactamase superfamily)
MAAGGADPHLGAAPTILAFVLLPSHVNVQAPDRPVQRRRSMPLRGCTARPSSVVAANDLALQSPVRNLRPGVGMHIRYIGHAGVALDVAGRHVLCDPWWNGPAFAGQWHPFPRPRPQPEDTSGVDVVFLSHGHEDHLHVPTLRLLRRDALVVLPRLRDPGLHDFVRSLGFDRVLELGHGQRRLVVPGLAATAYALREDCVFVLEGGGRTLVNANDALQSAPTAVVEDLCDTIRGRHGRIDFFAALCGATTWHGQGLEITDDVAFDPAAAAQAAIDRFALVARRIGARMALPFEPAFFVLEAAQRSQRVARPDATAVRAALRRIEAGDIVVHALAPGDRLVGDRLRLAAERPATAGEVEAALRNELVAAAAKRRAQPPIDPAQVSALLDALRDNAVRRTARVLRDTGSLRCRIDLRDVPEVSFLVDAGSRTARVTRCDRMRLAPIVLSTRFEVLEALAFQDCGDEAIRLGGGATLQLRRRHLALAEPLIALLGRRPLPPTRGESFAAWLRDPRRAFEAARRDRHLRRLARRLSLDPNASPADNVHAESPRRADPSRVSAR